MSDKATEDPKGHNAGGNKRASTAAPPPDGESEPVIIKRYASRKLYDAEAKEYVTIEDIARYIREGKDVQIIDKNTGEDLTRQYLVQIIADFESQGESALPLNLLTDLVRHYQEQASTMTNTLTGAMTPAFLGQMFETFKSHQEKAMAELNEFGRSAMDPEKMMGSMGNAFEEWQQRQTDFFSQAMRQWGFDPGGDDAAKSASGGKAPDAHDAKSGPASDDPQKQAKIEALQKHMAALQAELDKLR